MIPKIIHFCWLSNDPYPESIQKCIDSWKQNLPDYEIRKWDFNRFPRESSEWVCQAFDNRKYAFAADYIRLYALYNYGGIYLDSDVEVVKNFDELLSLSYFLGKENSIYGIEAAVIGVEKGMPWIKDCLDYYTNRSFVLGAGKFDTTPLPKIMLDILSSKYIIQDIDAIEEFVDDNKIINRFPVDWFSPKCWDTGILTVTENTKSIHHFSGTWKKNKGFLERIRDAIVLLKYHVKRMIRG